MIGRFFRNILLVTMLCIVTILTGCEKIMDTGMTDGVVTPPDTMPTLKVGLIHPHPNYISFGNGAKLAQAEINAAGGVLDMQIELVFRQEDTETVVESTNDLIENENVVAILGPLFSSHAVKVGPVATVPVLLGATRSEVTAESTDPNDLMFLIAGSNVLQAELLAKVVVEQLEAETAGMLWLDGDVYSIGFKSSFEARGGNVVVQHTYQGSDTTYDMQLSAVKEAAPDVLLLASFPPANPHIMKQALDMEITSIFIGSDGWDDPLMSTTLEDNEPVDGYYCTNLDPSAVNFISAYEMEYGSVDGIAAAGYDAMYILAQAIETLGSADDPVAIRDAIAAMTDYEGATTISRFDENRNPIKSVGVRQILNGMPQPNIIEAAPE